MAAEVNARIARRFALLAVLFAVGFGLVRVLQREDSGGSFGAIEYSTFEGGELALMLIASSRCGACNHEELVAAFPDMVSAIAGQAEERGLKLAVVGIGVDHRPEDAVTYFDGLGAFNELIVGRGWTNTGAFRYVWEGFRGQPSTPQVVVAERVLSPADDPSVRLLSERVLLRMLGSDRIVRWIDEGAPVPR